MKMLIIKYKEIILYLFFGGLTFLVSMVSFGACNLYLGMNEHAANIISWILAVTFAFITNRIWVFDAPTDGRVAFLKQMVSFFSGRVATLLVEEAIIFLFITMLHFPSMVIKCGAQFVVIVLNYVISKVFVFKK